MKRLTIAIILPALAIGSVGCARLEKPRPVEIRTQLIEVAVRAPCPAPDERARLRDLRPPRLADQPMPDTARERVAKTTAQLGRYEAPGAWADQVDAVLDRCQLGP